MVRWIPLVLILTGTVHAQRANPQKLREAVCIPRPPFNFSHGGNLTSDAKPPTIAEIEKRMRGDDGDAEHYIALARHYNRDTEKEKVNAALRKAYTILEKRCRLPGCTGYDLALAGTVLIEMERLEEGAALCRRALETSPADYRCWLEMAMVHKRRFYKSLTGGKDMPFNWKLDADQQVVVSSGLKPEDAAVAEKHLKELWSCYHKLVELSPLTEEAVLSRIGIVLEGNMLDKVVLSAQGKLKPHGAAEALYHPLFADELMRLAEARGHDMGSYAMALNLRIAMLHVPGPGEVRAELTKEEKASLIKTLAPLSKLADHADKETAWNSAMMVGVFLEQFVEAGSGDVFYRKALKLFPERNAAAENLGYSLAIAGKDKEALEVLEAQYERQPTVRVGLLLAHHLFNMKQHARAGAIVQELAAKHGEDPSCRLALAAIALSQSADPKQLAQAGAHLDKARQSLFVAAGKDKFDPAQAKGIEFNKDDPEHWRKCYQFLNALYRGMNDEPLQAYVELRTLDNLGMFARWVPLALKAFEE